MTQIFLFLDVFGRINFAFFTILKSFFGTFTNLFWSEGAGGSGHAQKSLVNIFSVIIILPLFSYLLLKTKNFKENKKTVIFLILSLLLILLNPQIRYTLTLSPIILLNLGKILNKKQFKIHIVFSILLSILVVIPYLIQINYITNAEEFTSSFTNLNKLHFSKENPNKIIQQDLEGIAKDFPNQSFIVVGPENFRDDYYAYLANLYWGYQIKEFVSVQDYELYLSNETLIFEKEFHPIPRIDTRREIWIKGGISSKIEDYSFVKYAISNETEIDLNGFNLVKSYKKLSVFEKI